MLGCLIRKMRRKGFGVHSPAAYNFIRNVIAEKYYYYEYRRLPKDKLSRLLYRISVDLDKGVSYGSAFVYVFKHKGLKPQQGSEARAAFRAKLSETPNGWAFLQPGKIGIILTPLDGHVAPPMKIIKLKIL